MRYISSTVSLLALWLALAPSPSYALTISSSAVSSFQALLSSSSLAQDIKDHIISLFSSSFNSHIPAPSEPFNVSISTGEPLKLAASFGVVSLANKPPQLGDFALGIQMPGSDSLQSFDALEGSLIDSFDSVHSNPDLGLYDEVHCRLKQLTSGALILRVDVVGISEGLRFDFRADLLLANRKTFCGVNEWLAGPLSPGAYQQWIFYHGSGVPVSANAFVFYESNETQTLTDIFHNTLYPGQQFHLANVTVQGTCPRPLAVPFYVQGGTSPWANDVYDFSKRCTPQDPQACTMAALGCAITSEAMIFTFHGSPINPGQLNTLLKNNNGFCGEGANPRVAACQTNGKVDFVDFIGIGDLRQGKKVTLDDLRTLMEQDLKTGNPVVVEVLPLLPKTSRRWVVITGPKCGTTWPINDPNGLHKELKGYGNNVFYLVRFKKGLERRCGPQFSACAVSLVELQITDTLGHKTGFDPTSESAFVDIENSFYFDEALRNDVTSELSPDVQRLVSIDSPINGFYKIEAIGINTGLFHLIFTAHDGAEAVMRENLTGVTIPGLITAFEVNYTNTAGKPFEVTRVVTFESVRQDIELLLAQGLIDNWGIANGLLQKLNNAQVKLVFTKNTQAAQSMLNALLNELEAQADKHIKGEAFEILSQDIKALKKKIAQNP